MIAATGSMPFQANWDVINDRYPLVALVLNLPGADLQPGQVSLNPKTKGDFCDRPPDDHRALDRITKSINLWGTGETPFLMRSDLEPNFAHVYGITRDDRDHGIEMEKLSFTHSGPLGRAQTMLTNGFILPERSMGRTSLRINPSHRRATKPSRTRSAVWIMPKRWHIWFVVWRRS